MNLHHLPDVVRGYLAARTGPPAVLTSYEPQLLGSAGTLVANRDWVAGEDFFLACNADNLTDFDLRSLIKTHARAPAGRHAWRLPLRHAVHRRGGGSRRDRHDHQLHREA